MKVTSYKEAIKYLEGFIGKVIFKVDKESLKHHDPLERMRMLLSLLGNPQDKFPSILIGGTAGKGSTAYLISHILTTAGYKTGLTLSPHLQRVNERIQISKAQSSKLKMQNYLPTGDLPQGDNSKVKSYSSSERSESRSSNETMVDSSRPASRQGGQARTINGLEQISSKEFVDLLNRVIPAVEQMKRLEIGAPSYFEILIAMAFKYFADQKVDIAVVEVGMGGEFDATNTLYPLVAVITNVSLDHTSVLGGTVQKIARTKVGIIKGLMINDKGLIIEKKGKKIHPSSLILNPSVITGVKQPSVIKIVEDRCKKVGAEILRLNKDFSAKGGPASGWDFKIKKESIDGSVFDLTLSADRRKRLNNLKLSLLGKYQIENASLAIEAVLQLGKFGFKISERHIRKALKTAFFPGRFEVIKCHPEFISGSYSSGDEMLKRVQHDKEKTLVLDGAHNPTKMKAFLSTLQKLYPKNPKIFVVAFKFDKDISKMLKQICRVADGIIVTEFRVKTDVSTNATMPVEKIIKEIKKLRNYDIDKVAIEGDLRKALERAFNLSTIQQFNNETIIVVTGSLYLVGEVRSML